MLGLSSYRENTPKQLLMVRVFEPFMSISLGYLSSTNIAAHKCCLGNILLMILVTGMGVMQANAYVNLKIEPVTLVIVSEEARQPQVGHQMKWWASLYTNMLTQSNKGHGTASLYRHRVIKDMNQTYGTRRKDSTQDSTVMTLSSKRV